MEFWGVEVKSGTSLKVKPDENKLIHISQAALGDVKNNKGAESVPLRLKIDDSKFVLGTLSAVTRPQLTFDLVFEKEFELSHDWKNGSVYLCGYTADNPYPDEGLDDDFSSGEEFSSGDDEDINLDTLGNGKLEPKVEKEKPAKSTLAPAKPESSKKLKAPVVPKKDEEDSDDDDEEDDSDDVPELGSDDDMSEDDESDDDDDDEDDDEDEETPKKPVSAKKRPSESALKTPVQSKKAKSETTPQKTDGKKSGGHTATPHPSKKAEKTPASKNKGKEQSPKSAANIKCNSCSKTFNSDVALQSHSKAKHSAAK